MTSGSVALNAASIQKSQWQVHKMEPYSWLPILGPTDDYSYWFATFFFSLNFVLDESTECRL